MEAPRKIGFLLKTDPHIYKGYMLWLEEYLFCFYFKKLLGVLCRLFILYFSPIFVLLYMEVKHTCSSSIYISNKCRSFYNMGIWNERGTNNSGYIISYL